MHSVKVKTTSSRDFQLPHGLSLVECWLVCSLGSSIVIDDYFRWTFYYKFSGSGSSHAWCANPLQSPTWVIGCQMCPKKIFIIHLYSGIQELGKKLWRLCKVDDKVWEHDSLHSFLKSVNDVYGFHHSGYSWPVQRWTKCKEAEAWGLEINLLPVHAKYKHWQF